MSVLKIIQQFFQKNKIIFKKNSSDEKMALNVTFFLIIQTPLHLNKKRDIFCHQQPAEFQNRIEKLQNIFQK